MFKTSRFYSKFNSHFAYFFKKFQLDYSTVSPACFHNKRKASPGCCHGKPMPWTVTEILEAPRNDTKVQECMTNMGPEVRKFNSNFVNVWFCNMMAFMICFTMSLKNCHYFFDYINLLFTLQNIFTMLPSPQASYS